MGVSDVISGSTKIQIIKTGTGTAIGAIANRLTGQLSPTAFETGTHRFRLLMMRLTILLVLFVLLVNALIHKPRLESFLFPTALPTRIAGNSLFIIWRFNG